MRATASLLMLALLCGAVTADRFAAFKQKYEKRYSSPGEESRRRAIFEANMAKAGKQQASEPYATFGAGPFADLTPQEFSVYHSSGAQYKKLAKVPLKTVAVGSSDAAGKAVDWVSRGAVTKVKNQGECGSCWSFSTTGGIEGQWVLANNTLTSVSEQELVSCDTTDYACSGGLMKTALEWLLDARSGDIVTEASYPYVSGDGAVPKCNMTNRSTGATITGYNFLPKNEDSMAAWVYQNGPLSIAVDASTWQHYNGGIMTNCKAGNLDHGVLIVGFNSKYKHPYWIVKNSWTAGWGEDGYIRLAMGSNQCSIQDYPITSVVPRIFVQERCQDSKCTTGCRNNTFPTNTCIPPSLGGPVKVRCTPTDIQIDFYSSTTDCSGPVSQTVVNAVDKCMDANGGGYLLNSCPAPGVSNTTGSGGKIVVL